MTIQEADEIVTGYGAALTRGCPDKGVARYESYLPCSKDRIKKAFKLTFAFLIEHNAFTRELQDSLFNSIIFLEQFVPDAVARRINVSHLNHSFDKEYQTFATSNMVNFVILREMEEFIAAVRGLDSSDPLYKQRIYTMIGLEYSPPKKRSFWSRFSSR